MPFRKSEMRKREQELHAYTDLKGKPAGWMESEEEQSVDIVQDRRMTMKEPWEVRKKSCEPACPLQGSLGPSRPERPKISTMSPRPRKVRQKSHAGPRDSPGSPRRVVFFGLSPGVGRHFSRLVLYFGPGGPERPRANRGLVPQKVKGVKT